MNAFQNQINEIMAELEQSQRDLRRAQARISEVSRTTQSGNRMVSATVDARGQLTGLQFHGTKYRSLPGPELADLIVRTVRKAKSAAAAEVQETMKNLLPGHGLPPILAKAIEGSDLAADLLDPQKLFGDLGSLFDPAPTTGAETSSADDNGWSGERPHLEQRPAKPKRGDQEAPSRSGRRGDSRDTR